MYGGDEVSSLVFDIGTFNARFGYSGEDSPKFVFQSQIGNSKNNSVFVGENDLRFFKPGIKICSPLNNQGFIENIDSYESMINHVYSKCLKAESKDHPVLFSEPGIHNKENRNQLVQLMFEKFQIPAIFTCKSPVLSAFSCGRSTALIFDSGHNTTWASTVHDGYVLYKSQIKYDIGGSTITNQLSKILKNKGVNVTPHYRFNKNIKDDGSFSTEYLDEDFFNDVDPNYELFWKNEIVRDIKETSLTFSENIDAINYELPDGINVELNSNERKEILDSMFEQNKNVPGFNGFQYMVHDAISKADIDIKKDLYSNIFATGGNTIFTDFIDKFNRVLNTLAPNNVKVKVLSHPTSLEKKLSAWIGGSILSSLGTFHQIWFSKQEYEEHGSVLIERKCA